MTLKKNYRISFILIIIIVMMYLFYRINPDTFYSLFVLKSSNIQSILPWQFITYAFYFPEQIFFFFFTVLIFFWFSTSLEEIWGSFYLAGFILTTILFKSIFGFLFGLLPIYGNYSLYVSLMVAFGFNFPDLSIRLFFIIPIKVKVLAIISLVLIGLQVIGSFLYAPSYLNIVSYSNAIIKIPLKVSFFIFTLSSYSGIIFFYKKIFGEGHFTKIFNISKKNIQIIETKIKEQNINYNNSEYANIYKNLEKNKTISQSDKDLINKISNDTNDLCSDKDFEMDDNYCLTCDKFSKCIKRNIINNKLI